MVKYGAGRDFYRRRYAVARPEVCAADIAAVFKECAPYFELDIDRLEELLAMDLSSWRLAGATGMAA